MKLASLEAIISALRSADAHHRESWIRDKNMVDFQLHIDTHPKTRIDLFVSEPFDFDTEYERALSGDILPDLPARFACLATLIRMKESAGRPKDLEDIRQLQLLAGDQHR
jgi:hypothetical protein